MKGILHDIEGLIRTHLIHPQALEAWVRISETVFSGASSAGSGGALSLVGCDAALNGAAFENCTSFGDSGALSAEDYACTRSVRVRSLTRIADSRFTSCRAGRGGAVSSVAGGVEVHGSKFVGNAARDSGGAIFVGAGGTLAVADATLTANAAGKLGGGAVHIQNVSASLLAGLVGVGNMALVGGGGVVLWEGLQPPTFACGAGAIHASKGHEIECALCPPGTYQSGLGKTDPTDCVACVAGSYSEIPGASVCTLCAPGTYDATGIGGAESAASCVACALGTFQNAAGVATPDGTCATCRAGTYSSTTGSSVCASCQAGRFSTAIGATEAAACTALCAPGTYSAGGWSACTACDAGTFTSAPGTPLANVGGAAAAIACGVCGAGMFSAVGASTCSECSAGTYAEAGATACAACAPGTYAAGPGLASCSVCAQGLVASADATACTACWVGSLARPAPVARVGCNCTGSGLLCGLNTRCADAGCGRGTIGRMVAGEAYDNGETATWIIAAAPGAIVTLSFTFLRTEPQYDAVRVYACADAACTLPAPSLLGEFSGTDLALPLPVSAATGVMQVVWDGSDACCPKPSAVCTCDNPANTFLLTGWTADFQVIQSLIYECLIPIIYTLFIDLDEETARCIQYLDLICDNYSLVILSFRWSFRATAPKQNHFTQHLLKRLMYQQLQAPQNGAAHREIASYADNNIVPERSPQALLLHLTQRLRILYAKYCAMRITGGSEDPTMTAMTIFSNICFCSALRSSSPCSSPSNRWAQFERQLNQQLPQAGCGPPCVGRVIRQRMAVASLQSTHDSW